MLLGRQTGNILVDYDIYLASLQLLREISTVISNWGPPSGISVRDWRTRHIEFEDYKAFEQVSSEFELQRRYAKLYEHRTMINNNEVNQAHVAEP